MAKHPNQFQYKKGYNFQGLVAVLIAALAVAGGYGYYRASKASGAFIGVAASPNGNVFKLDAGGCVNGGGPVCNASLTKPVSGIAAYGGNNTGYWVVAGDGGVFTGGGAPYYGSEGGKALNAPIVAIAGSPDGRGYWLLGSDGGVFTFGSVPYKGNGLGKGTDFKSITSSPSGNGYWLVRSSGQVYAFGDASGTLNAGNGVAGIAGGVAADGFWVLNSNGGVSHGGSVQPIGSMGSGQTAVARYGNNSFNCIIGITGGGSTTIRCTTPGANIAANPSTVAYNTASTLSWSSSFASGCNISGIGNVAYQGAVNTGPLTASKSYTITCSNPAATSASRSVAITVNPPPVKGGGSTGSGSGSSGGHSGGSSSSKGSGAPPADTQPPSIPNNLIASLDSDVVNLSWNASSDNVAVDHYELDRSLDQTVWTSMSNHVVNTTFTDKTVGFGTTYYYRVRAVDGAGNASDYATAQVTTGDFNANLSQGQDTTITSDDNIVQVTLPAGSIDAQADCSLVTDSDHADKLPLKNTALITGPYSLVCKKQSGDTIDAFNSPAKIQVKLTTDQTKRYHNFSFYSYASSGDNWTKFKTTYDKKAKAYNFTSGSALQFAVLGSVKKGVSAQVIILVIMFILLLGGVGYYLYQRAQKSNYQEYIRKKYYNL